MVVKATEKEFSFLNTFRKTIAVFLIISLISLVACNKNEGVSSDSSNESDSPESNSEVSKIDPLLGDISFETDIEELNIRDDANEILPKGNCSNLSNPISGFVDEEAESLRKKILNTGNTEDFYKIKGKKYYISPGGNDDNNGLSPNKALRSVDGLSNVELEAGDAVLFERNSVFRLFSSISAEEGIIYGSYGNGEKPKIYASSYNFAQSNWKPSNRKNIWMTNYVYDTACSAIFNHGEQIGYLKTSVRNLAKNTDFYQDESGGVLYLYCDKGNPSNCYTSIEIAPKMDVFNIPGYTNDVVIDNLCLKYSGSFAVNCVFANNNISVTNCEIGYIGGMNNGSVRYGNAVQVWTGTENFSVTNNWIYQTFDTAVSWQGYGGEGCKYRNITFSGNLLEYNNGDYEFWDAKAKLDNFVMERNIFRFTSLGWGTRADDAGYRGIEGVFVGKTSNMVHLNKVIIKNNIIDSPGRQIINLYIDPEHWDKYYEISGTKVFVNASIRTTQQVLRGSKRNASDAEMLNAKNYDDLKKAMLRFDPTVEVEYKN